MKGRVFIIAGSDSGGGAGIQGDIKTVTALGGYAATAITALTAQNTKGVFGIHEVPTDFIKQQMELVLSDIGADCLKTGMLHSSEVIDVVAEVIKKKAKKTPLVLDPVMVAKGGAPLLMNSAISSLNKNLLPLAFIITPNIPEAEILTGMKIKNTDDMVKAGKALLKMGAKAALIKGGHLESNVISDVLVTAKEIKIFKSKRIKTKNTHGTGCTLASAIATGIAQKMTLEKSVIRARKYVLKAIKTAPKIGKGHGPLNHAV